MQLREESFHGFHLDPMNGRWFLPPPGYVKLNVDGSVINGNATYGGVLRDHEGNWVWGFTGSCGHSSPLAAELLALKEGLVAVLNNRCLCVIIESDSSIAVQLINGYPEENHPFMHIILECKSLFRRIWSCSITYVPRNYNNSADCIAKLGHTICSLGESVWFNEPPSSLLEVLRGDNIM